LLINSKKLKQAGEKLNLSDVISGTYRKSPLIIFTPLNNTGLKDSQSKNLNTGCNFFESGAYNCRLS
jgi:hypothetical protein